MQLATRHQKYDEKRSEPRVLSQGTALLSAGDSNHQVTIIDISRSGMQVESPEPIAVRTQVRLDFQDMTVLGRVGNCRSHGAARFRVGILTEDVIEHAAS